jgi:hypothetical protein
MVAEVLTPTRLSQLAGVSLPYASQLLRGERPFTLTIAVRVWKSGRLKLGPVVGATDDEMGVIERFAGRA